MENCVTEDNKKHIQNLVSATAARVTTQEVDSDAASDDSELERFKFHAGSPELVAQTLQGIASFDEEEGRIGIGKHAACIRMGRHVWETPVLTESEKNKQKNDSAMSPFQTQNVSSTVLSQKQSKL